MFVMDRSIRTNRQANRFKRRMRDERTNERDRLRERKRFAANDRDIQSRFETFMPSQEARCANLPSI